MEALSQADNVARRIEVLGTESIGFLWPAEEEEEPEDSDDEEMEDPFEHPANKRLLQLGRSLSNLSLSSDTPSTLSAASSAPSSPMSQASDDSMPDIPSLSLDAVPPAFYSEARASLERAYEENHTIENASLELRTLVMAYNAGLDRTRKEISSFLMSKVDVSGNAPAILSSVVKVWTSWGEMVERYTSDPTNIALDAQAWCVDNESYRPYFGIVLRGLYEADMIGEEELVEWRSLSTAQGEGTKDEKEKAIWKEVWAKGKAYVDVLEDMESESEEESEDESEEEE